MNQFLTLDQEIFQELSLMEENPILVIDVQENFDFHQNHLNTFGIQLQFPLFYFLQFVIFQMRQSTLVNYELCFRMRLILGFLYILMQEFSLIQETIEFILLERLLEDFGNSDILIKLVLLIVLDTLFIYLLKMELLHGEISIQMYKHQITKN